MPTNVLRAEPWLTETANKMLEEIIAIGKNLSVFEFGAGASTIWFSKQTNITHLVSVEHDEKWRMEVALKQQSATSILIHMQQPYNTAIDSFGLFDIILVDGRNRVKCIESAIPHLKPNGILILDNSERDYYAPGIKLLSDFKRIDTLQPQPDKYGFTYPGWQTSFFYKIK